MGDEIEGLFNVSEQMFYNFLEGKNYKQQMGSMVHSDEFIDSEGKIIAYRESSSYNPHVIYKIKDETYQNFDTVVLMSKLLF